MKSKPVSSPKMGFFRVLWFLLLAAHTMAFDSLQGRNKNRGAQLGDISTKLLKLKPDDKTMVLNILDSMKSEKSFNICL